MEFRMMITTRDKKYCFRSITVPVFIWNSARITHTHCRRCTLYTSSLLLGAGSNTSKNSTKVFPSLRTCCSLILAISSLRAEFKPPFGEIISFFFFRQKRFIFYFVAIVAIVQNFGHYLNIFIELTYR